jgi:hypothetical protein
VETGQPLQEEDSEASTSLEKKEVMRPFLLMGDDGKDRGRAVVAHNDDMTEVDSGGSRPLVCRLKTWSVF